MQAGVDRIYSLRFDWIYLLKCCFFYSAVEEKLLW
uniref:Uncharacterized protein n=1 Tax=Arundo donax TaxID=35708 RepID=A0A0A8ZYK4_ARUDO